jgi:hypothetical protein
LPKIIKDSRDGISDLTIDFDGLDQVRGSADVIVRFRILRLSGGVETELAILPFPVPASADGVEGQIARAWFVVESALKQMTFQAEKARESYDKKPA